MDTPISVRGAALALHLFAGKSWTEISQILKLTPDVVSRFCREAIERAEGLPPDWQEPENTLSLSRDQVFTLFQQLQPRKPDSDSIQLPGRLPRLVAGSQQAEDLRSQILLDEEHQDMSWIDVAKEMGLDIAESTLENFVHKVLDIHRYEARTKPRLNRDNKSKRVEFAIWALEKINW